MRVRFSPRSNRGDVIDVGEIDGPPVGGMDLAFKKLLQDENWSCSQHMVLNDADRRGDIRESEDNGAETLFMPESIRAVEEPLLGSGLDGWSKTSFSQCVAFTCSQFNIHVDKMSSVCVGVGVSATDSTGRSNR